MEDRSIAVDGLKVLEVNIGTHSPSLNQFNGFPPDMELQLSPQPNVPAKNAENDNMKTWAGVCGLFSSPSTSVLSFTN